MCGILGIFNNPQAEKLVKKGLIQLEPRGKDDQGLISKQNHTLGHRLHSIINHVKQPIQAEGILAANCEIYNWQKFKGKNDTEALLHGLDQNGIEFLKELDGVYAFVYWKENTITIARDLLGVKPLWYTQSPSFAVCSERKILRNLGFTNIRELHPRTILNYNLTTKEITTTYRDFFKLTDPTDPAKTKDLLNNAIKKRIPNVKCGVLFSGGIDSTYIANYLKQQNIPFTCYTTGVGEAHDIKAAKEVAQKLNLPLKTSQLTSEEIAQLLPKIVPLIEDNNVVKVGVAITLYAAAKLAQKDGCKVLFSGLGSEEIFAGYERHRNALQLNKECLSGLRKLWERDLYRDDVLTMDNSIELRLPFLDHQLVRHSLNLPPEQKLHQGHTKYILRKISETEGLPHEFAFRKKKAAQYGSRVDAILGKLAKGRKSSYLKQFYPQANHKLGVLFSGGKDSAYAAYIMQRQNYELTCLLTMKSTNPDSYMFHTPAINLTKLQAEAMQIPIIIQSTTGEKEKELVDLRKLLQKAIKEYHITGITTGAVLSTYQRDRIEQLCDELGLAVFSPLWQKDPNQEMQELLQNNFKFCLSSIAAEGLNETWLGREIDQTALTELQKINKKTGITPNGEGGEYESLVLNCPLFKKEIKLNKTKKIMEKTHTGHLLIEEATCE